MIARQPSVFRPNSGFAAPPPMRNAASERCRAAQRGLASLFAAAYSFTPPATVLTDCTPSTPRKRRSNRSMALITSQFRQASSRFEVSAYTASTSMLIE
ncbi:hypothetical protein D3C76_1643930 [compost metagenome]